MVEIKRFLYSFRTGYQEPKHLDSKIGMIIGPCAGLGGRGLSDIGKEWKVEKGSDKDVALALYVICYLCSPPNFHVEVQTFNTSECELLWKQSYYTCS